MDENKKPSYLPLLQYSSDEDADVKFKKKLDNKCETNIKISSNLSSDISSSEDFLASSKKDRIKKKRKRRRRKMESFERSELMGTRKKKKQILLLAALLLLGVVVIIGIVLGVVLSNNDENQESAPLTDDREPIGLEDYLRGRLSARRFNGSWISDDTYYYFDIIGDLETYNVKTNETKTILNSLESNLVEGFSFEFSPDQKHLLVGRNRLKIFRHSFLAFFDVVDLETKAVTPITINGKQEPLRLVKWNPMDRSLIINYGDNLYYKKTPDASEIQITTDGGNPKNPIVNGVPDWVYEEEVFSSNTATWYSKDGKKIVYIKFNDTNVPLMSIPVYGIPGDRDFQYPHHIGLHYPKVSTPNPTVSLHYVNLEKLEENGVITETVNVPKNLRNEHEDHLITSVSWVNDKEFMVMWMNRVQNKGILEKCTVDANNVDCKQAAAFNPYVGWVDFFTEPFYNKEGTLMAYINSYQAPNTTDSFRHIHIMNLGDFSSYALTTGNYVVFDIYGWHKEKNVILFKANSEKDSKDQHLYAVTVKQGSKTHCLTCNLDHTWTKYSHFNVEFSKDLNNFALTSLGPEIPRADLFDLKIEGEEMKVTHLKDWETNPELHKFVAQRKVPTMHYDEIDLGNGFSSRVQMYLPADLDKSKKHPMLIEVYGGPDSAMVSSKFSLDWGSHLVSNSSIIYAKIDGRGSGQRGDNLMNALYRKLGTVEIEDQITTAKKLQEKYSYIDKNRTAIWGWSYGGYAAGMSLATDKQHVFKCAMSVAPVTDWILYDSIYTERYMGLIEENQAAYINSKLFRHIEGLRDKKYLLVHGTLDDNVHFQQGALLAKALERADIDFDQISYTDEDHSLSNVRPHLYHGLGKFVDECFQLGR